MLYSTHLLSKDVSYSKGSVEAGGNTVADDIWTGLVNGVLAFGHSRAADLTENSFKDTGKFVTTLGDGASGTTKTALDKLKDDIKALSAEATPIIDAVKPKIKDAADAVQRSATDLGTDPFTMAAAGRIATELANVLIAVDAALLIIAEKLSKKGTPDFKQDVFDGIAGIDKPWKAPFENLAADAGKTLDAIGKQLLGEDKTTKKLGDVVTFDRIGKELNMRLVKTGERAPVAGFDAFKLDSTELIAFLNFKDKAVVGVRVKTKIKAGLRSDKFLEKIIPGGAPSSDTDYTSISLDSGNGLTFGDGKNKTLMLPVRFAFPGVELREFAIVVSDQDGEIDIKATIAAKMGDVVGFVVEGGGVEIHYRPNPAPGQDPFSIAPRLPDAAGVRIKVAGVLTGGGYIYRKDKEYGGILDLQLLKIGITVIAIVTTEPFSFVVVIAVKFTPKIELSFGFTLNGIGGILAVERRVSTDELRKGIRDGTADTILFPENPIDAAPKILDKVRNIFPLQQGGFVVGPIALLGWGSQAGFVVAKVGIVLSLPDPKLILLGALQIGVPSADIDPKLRIVDLHAEVYGEFTPEYMLILVGLNNSKIAGISIGGDIGLFVRWAGGQNFALTVGGFHPKYTPPPELTGLRRITIDLSPVSFLKLHAEAYFAITANSLQFGGGITLSAEIGPASADAWLKINVLFVWSPRFYFEADLDIGITIKVFGFTLCGARFQGMLEGTHPWRAQGLATIDLGFFGSYDFHLGPVEWGERDTSLPPAVSPLLQVQQALGKDDAWKTLLPGNGDMLVILVRDETTPLLVHPLGLLEIKQQNVPLEVHIDRIGSAPVTANRVNLAAPMVGGSAAKSFTNLTEFFAAGHFVEMTKDQQVSRPDFESFACGMKIAAARVPQHGTALGAVYRWETGFPHETVLLRRFDLLAFTVHNATALRVSAVGVAARERTSPYELETVEAISIQDAGQVMLRHADDLSAVIESPKLITTTEAARVRIDLQIKGVTNIELVAMGATQ